MLNLEELTNDESKNDLMICDEIDQQLDEIYVRSTDQIYKQEQRDFNQLIERNEEIEEMLKMGLPANFGSKVQIKTEQSIKKKKKKENIQRNELDDILCFQRRKLHLFSKYNLFENILIDDQMWYSITPEIYAKRTAIYCKKKIDYTVLLDGFCGLGGNLIQFAANNKNAFIVGIDSCIERVENAKKIAKIYKVENQCDFICGDFMQLAPCLQLKPDIVFLSPPWGGTSYKRKKSFLLKNMPINGNEIFEISKKLTKNIVYYLPRNQCKYDLFKLNELFSSKLNESKNFGSTLNVYFGDLVDQKTIEESNLFQFSDKLNFKTSFKSTDDDQNKSVVENRKNDLKRLEASIEDEPKSSESSGNKKSKIDLNVDYNLDNYLDVNIDDNVDVNIDDNMNFTSTNNLGDKNNNFLKDENGQLSKKPKIKVRILNAIDEKCCIV